MESVWLKVLNQSISVSVVILAVLLVRGIIMRKLPKKYVFLLWAVVGIRLLIPVGVTTSINWFHTAPYKVEQFTENNVEKESTAQKQKKAEYSGTTDEKEKSEVFSASSSHTEKSQESKKRSMENIFSQGKQGTVSEKVIQVTAYLWIGGMVLFGIWNVILYVRMKSHLQQAVLYQDNIFECDNIGSPFVMGLLHPRIYIPFRLRKEDLSYILKHEQYHIQRKDYFTKLVACILMGIYWFHPLVWVAYFYMVRDMEMSCDEYVVQAMGNEIKKEYSASLLAFATNTRGLSVGMLAFGESGTRKRVKHILKAKKSGKWIGIVGIVLVIVTGIFCFVASDIGEPIKKVAKGVQKEDTKDNLADEEDIWQEEPIVISGYGYQIDIPDSWEKKGNKNINLKEYYEKKTKVASVETFTQCWYATSVQSIVTNLYGMHASIAKKEKIRQEDGFTLVKIIVDYEPTAAEQKNGKENWQDQHYLFMNGKDTFYDLWVNTEKLSTDTIAELVDSFHVTSDNGTEMKVFTVKADVTGDGIEDEININWSDEVVAPETEEQVQVVGVISGATKNDVYVMGNYEDINLTHPGYNSLYLYHGEGQDSLLNWMPVMYQGNAVYRYEIFTVDESGKKDILEKEEFSFDLDNMKKEQVQKYKDFIEKVNRKLKKSDVLISTLNGNLVTYKDSKEHLLMFDASEDLDSMESRSKE